jgi:hypothetical protein
MLGEGLVGLDSITAMVAMIREIGFKTHEISKRNKQCLLMVLPHREWVSCKSTSKEGPNQFGKAEKEVTRRKQNFWSS